MNNISFIHLYTVEGYITFTISVISGEFSGISAFCISERLLQNAISSLNEIYINLEGSYQMNDYNSDDYIKFESLTLGHIEISGQVGGSYNQQYLKYQFTTDQTVLSGIISDFRSMIAKMT